MFEVKRKHWRILALFEANVWLNTSWEDSFGMVIKGDPAIFCPSLYLYVSIVVWDKMTHTHTHTYMMGTLCHTPGCTTHPSQDMTQTHNRGGLNSASHAANTQQLCMRSTLMGVWLSVPEEQAAVLKVSVGSGRRSLSSCSVYFIGGIFCLCNLPPVQRLRRLRKSAGSQTTITPLTNTRLVSSPAQVARSVQITLQPARTTEFVQTFEIWFCKDVFFCFFFI